MNAVAQIDKDVLRGILLAIGNGERTVTYGDLSKTIEGITGRRINPHTGFNVSLSRIQDYCIESSVPCLSALVVNQNQVPGSGFIDYYRKANPQDIRSNQEILADEQSACQENEDWEPLLKCCDVAPDEVWSNDEEVLDSEVCNWSVLVSILDQYEETMSLQRSKEVYKWEALKQFQDCWNLDVGDFHAMLCESLSKTGNLLTSRRYYAQGMIEILAENDPEAVRTSFKMLLNSNIPLSQRMERFSAEMDEQLDALNAIRVARGEQIAEKHYQDPHAMSVYLALAQDDEHYIYKARPYESFAARIGAGDAKGKYGKIEAFEDLCDSILDYLLVKRKDLVRKSDSLLPKELREVDPSHHMLAQDIVFYASWGIAKSWAYAPGEQAMYWDELRNAGIMGIGWEKIGDPSRFRKKNDLSDALIEAYGGTNPKQDTSSIWSFVRELKPGDIVWARKGTKHVVGCGVVRSDFRYDDSRVPYHSFRDVDWIEMDEFDVEETFHRKTLYELTEWTSVKTSELDELSQGAVDRDDNSWWPRLELEERTPEIEPCEKSYWWLNASPKIWSFSDIEPGAEQTYTVLTDNGTPRRIHSNFMAAKEGDIVIGYETTPVKKAVAVCEISRDTDDEHLYFRKLKDLTNPVSYAVIEEDDVLAQTQFVKNPNGSLFALTGDEFERVIELADDDAPILPTTKARPYGDEQFLKDVYVSSADLASMKRLLERKRNLILQGAPGTGKTYCAKRLAWAFMGEEDSSRICFVQFHQNTAYDDMMAGYRPADGGGFEAIPGEFLKFCDKAAQDAEQRPRFFIIDEINRANVSKVFGELLMLIESGHRDEAVKLSILGRSVKVPSNLYIIGMMNTADRGLALIDYALRRRFAFFEMEPAFGNDQFEAYIKSAGNEKLSALAEAVDKLNQEIASDPSLGSGFRIGHSYFCFGEDVSDEEVVDVVEYELDPLIREYWFDTPDTAEDKITQLKAAL